MSTSTVSGGNYASFIDFSTFPHSPARLAEADRTAALLGSTFGYQASLIRIPPYNPDSLISQKGYQLFDEMVKLAAVAGPVNLKREATLYKGWDLVPAIVSDKDPRYGLAQQIRDECYRILSDIQTDWGVHQSFRDVLWDTTDGYFKGWRVLELLWRLIEAGPDKGKLGFQRIRAVPNQQIAFDLDIETDIPVSLTSAFWFGAWRMGLPMEKVVHYVYRPQDNKPWGTPDGRAVYPSWWSLKAGFKFWAIAVEQFGSPFIMAKAPKGAVFATVQRMLADIRQGSPGVLPVGIEAQLHNVAAGGMQAFTEFISTHKGEIASVILGQESTTSRGPSTGSYGADAVRQDTQEFFLGGCRTSIEDVYNLQVLRRMVRYNWGPEFQDLAPKLSLGIWDQTDRLKFAQSIGLLLDRHVVHRTNPEIIREFGFSPIGKDEQALLDDEAQKAFEAGIKPNPAGPSTDGGPKNGQ